MPQFHTTCKFMTWRGRDTDHQQSRGTKKTIKVKMKGQQNKKQTQLDQQ